MYKTAVAVLLLAFLIAIVGLTGCPKKEAAELQGAPTAMPAPPTANQPTPAATEPTKPATEPAKPGETKTADAKAADADTASCPVLGTTMPKKDMIKYDYKGKTYYFCCQDCVTKFKANPQKYIEHPHAPLPVGAPMPMDD